MNLSKLKQLNLTTKIIIILVLALVFYYGYIKFFKSSSATATYKTALVERGTLVSSITASGTITSGNSLNITTSATGTVNKVLVKNGDTVKQGQKIAEITLDQDALQRQTQAWSSYLSAKNSLESAKSKLNSLQATAFKVNQEFINDAVARDLDTTDPTYIQQHATWLQAEADYKNQYNIISQSQVSLSSAWYSYQQVSSSVIAPATGTIANLIIASGTIISGSSNTSNSISTQKLGTVKRPNENTQASVVLSEVDVTKVKVGQNATITLDALPDHSFTGKVLMIDTNGQVSSGVASYPAIIQFDTSIDSIYPNMGINAKIITAVKDNILLVPSSAVQTVSGQKNVRTLQGGQLVNLPVEVGIASDTQVEITSGVSEGDSIVTSVINPTTTSTSTTQTASPFGNIGGRGGFGGAPSR